MLLLACCIKLYFYSLTLVLFVVKKKVLVAPNRISLESKQALVVVDPKSENFSLKILLMAREEKALTHNKTLLTL